MGRLLIGKRALQGSSIESHIDATWGPFIEVGAAPSKPNTGKLLDLGKVTKPLITSNIGRPRTEESIYRHRITRARRVVSHRDIVPSGRLWKYVRGGEKPTIPQLDESGSKLIYTIPEDRLDLIADAEALPMRDGTVGALYANALSPELEVSFITDEAPRVLEPGGVLVLGHAKQTTPEIAASRYFDTVAVREYGKSGRFRDYAAIRNSEPYQPQLPPPEQELTAPNSSTNNE